MLLNNHTKRQTEDLPMETLVVLSDDGTAEIMPVVDKNEERVLGSHQGREIAVPNGIVKHYTGRRGRVYVYASNVDSIEDCERIANLEKSTVLKQITHYVPQTVEPAKSFDMTKLLLFGLVIVELIIIAAH